MSEIDFIEVTVNLPKLIMEYLKRIYGDPVKWLEYQIVDCVSADIDAIDHKRITELFALGPVFKAILER